MGVAVKRGIEMTLFSHHEKALNKRFSSVVAALASLGGDFVLDGELVALDFQGIPSFQMLQTVASKAIPIHFYAFGLFNRNYELFVNLPFARRRETLESFLTVPKDPVRLSPLLQAPSRRVLEAVRKLGLEGVVGKRLDSIYGPGERSGAWIKLRAKRGAGVCHRLLRPRGERVRRVTRGRLRKQRTHLRRKSEERLLCREFVTNSSRPSRHSKLRSVP